MSRMSFDDAMDLADSMGLPDGAFWAMSHELAGLDYGEGFPLTEPSKRSQKRATKSAMMNAPKPHGLPHRCGTCGKDFATKGSKKRHRIDAHAKADATRKDGM